MLLSKKVKAKVNSANLLHYLDLGYQIPMHKDKDKKYRYDIGCEIEVLIKDLPEHSTTKVELCCDYCGAHYSRTYNKYLESHKYSTKDNCNSKECVKKKTEDNNLNKYGTNDYRTIIHLNGSELGRRTKYSFKDILDMCNKKNYTYLGEELTHIRVKDRINLSCNIHNTSFETPIENFMNVSKNNCPGCLAEHLSVIQSSSNISEALLIANEKDYTIVTDKINNCDDPILYYCNLHYDKGLQKTSLYGLQHYKNNCRWCKMPRQEEHHNWKGGISSERDKIKHTDEYKKWRDDVFKRDNYTCQCCGQRGGRLEAHHLYSFADYPELRTSVDNGITLCKKCHSVSEEGSFHNIYTQYHNTPEQLYEYINNHSKIAS